MRGRDLVSGLPRELHLDSVEVRQAIEAPLGEILAAVQETLEETPPELAGDIAMHGILLAGGGSLLHAFAERVREETGMPAQLVESPLTCVAVGAGHALEEFDVLSRSAWGRGAGARSSPLFVRSGTRPQHHESRVIRPYAA